MKLSLGAPGAKAEIFMSIFCSAFRCSAGRHRSAGKREPITSGRHRGRRRTLISYAPLLGLRRRGRSLTSVSSFRGLGRATKGTVLSPRARTFPKGSLDLGVSRRSAVAGSGAAKRRGDEVSDSDREHLHRAEQASLSARADPTADLPSVLGKNLKRQAPAWLLARAACGAVRRQSRHDRADQFGQELAHHQPPVEARDRTRRRARSSADAAGCARHNRCCAASSRTC